MNQASLGRYTLLALVFILIFVGVSYIAYLLTGHSKTSDGINTTTTVVSVSPTPQNSQANTVASSNSSNSNNTQVVYRLPLLSYQVGPLPTPPNQVSKNASLYQSNILNNGNTITAPVYQVINGQSISIVGQGNFLVNNLTHSENFQLQRELLLTDRAVSLAKEQDQLKSNTTTLQYQYYNNKLASDAATRLRLAEIQADQTSRTSTIGATNALITSTPQNSTRTITTTITNNTTTTSAATQTKHKLSPRKTGQYQPGQQLIWLTPSYR